MLSVSSLRGDMEEQDQPPDEDNEIPVRGVPFNRLLSSSKLEPCERGDSGIGQRLRSDKPGNMSQQQGRPCHRCYSARVLTRPQHFAYTFASDNTGNRDAKPSNKGSKSVSVVKLKEGHVIPAPNLRRSHTIAEMNSVRRKYTNYSHFRRGGTAPTPFNSQFPPIRSKSHKKSSAKDKVNQSVPQTGVTAKSADVIAKVTSVNSSTMTSSDHVLNGKATDASSFQNGILNGRKISVESNSSSIYTSLHTSSSARVQDKPVVKPTPKSKSAGKLELTGNTIDRNNRGPTIQRKTDLKEVGLEIGNKEEFESLVSHDVPPNTVGDREPTPSEVTVQTPVPVNQPQKPKATANTNVNQQQHPKTKMKIKFFGENEQESVAPRRTFTSKKPQSPAKPVGAHSARLLHVVPTQNIQDIVNRLPTPNSVASHDSMQNKPKISLTKRNLKIFDDIGSVGDSSNATGVEEIVLPENPSKDTDGTAPPCQRVLHWVKTHQTPEPRDQTTTASTIPDIPEEEEKDDSVSESVLQSGHLDNDAMENGVFTDYVMLSQGATWELQNGLSDQKSK